jgi:hypothetical protein
MRGAVAPHVTRITRRDIDHPPLNAASAEEFPLLDLNSPKL